VKEHAEQCDAQSPKRKAQVRMRFDDGDRGEQADRSRQPSCDAKLRQEYADAEADGDHQNKPGDPASSTAHCEIHFPLIPFAMPR
jgi:hypothetical protein